MQPRKRNRDKKHEKQESEKLVLEAKKKAQQTSAKSSPFGIFTLIFIIGSISAAVYVFYFVDIPETLGKLQLQFELLRGERSLESLSPDKQKSSEEHIDNSQPSPKHEIKKEKKIKVENTNTDPKKVSTQNDKVVKQHEKSSKDKNPSKKAASNSIDKLIEDELDKADVLLEKRPEEASVIYEKLLKKHSNSPRATYGKARALNKMAEVHRSNDYLEKSIEQYMKVFDLPDVPREIILKALEECVDRQQFRGWHRRALKTIRRVLEIYPNDLKLWNKLGVQQLIASPKSHDAKDTFKYVLKQNADNGFAKAHLGFILKTVDNDFEEGIKYLQSGVDSGEEGVIDGRFFFHLGDAYYRTGQHDKAYATYEKAVEHGLFKSVYQRSLYNVDRLESTPWWTMDQSGIGSKLKEVKKHWKSIREEGLAQLDPVKGSFIPEEENLRETGDWKQFTLFHRGQKNAENCKKAPKTCALIEKIPQAAGCRRGQVKFSVMHPGVHVWPHTGPTNCRIRAHLGLVVPDGPRIRVADETRTWKEGDFIIFDDSFEHEVWHNGTETRLVLIVDFWHPDLTEKEISQLSSI